MRFFITFTALVTLAASLPAQTADEIMAQVAKNQDADVAARSQFVYRQNILVRMKRRSGKIAREESRDYTVTPAPGGVKRELVHLSGTIGAGKNAIAYEKAEFRHRNVDLDGELVQGLADDFGADRKSKDGVSHDLFPLRSEMLSRYTFQLLGTEKLHDRDAYHLRFEPAAKRDIDDDCWAGEVMVDKSELQPLEVTSHLACKLPLLVKTILGTDVRQVGFKVTYQKFEGGVWFPVTYGGEFEFRAVFLYARRVGIGLVNSEFHRTRVESAIKYEMEQAESSSEK